LVIGEKERSWMAQEKEKLDGAREKEGMRVRYCSKRERGLKYTKFFWHSATIPSHI